MKKLSFLSFIFLVYTSAAQPNIEWERCYGGTSVDEAYFIRPIPTGGYYLAGDSYSVNGDVSGLIHDGNEFWIVRLDAVGNIIWQRCCGGDNHEWLQGFAVADDGSCVAVGATNSNDWDVSGFHGGERDAWVIKLSATGAVQWQRTLGGTYLEEAFGVTQGADGGFLVVGVSHSVSGDVTENKGLNDVWMIKLSASGDMEWQRSIGGVFSEKGMSVDQAPDGGYYIAAESKSFDGDVVENWGETDFWVIKISATGNIEWNKNLGSTSSDSPNSIKHTHDGGCVVAGYVGNNTGNVSGYYGYLDYWVVKLDASGNIQWERSLGGSDMDKAYDIIETTDGDYVVIGHTSSTNGAVSNNDKGMAYWVVKLDHDGIPKWDKCFGGSNIDWGNSICQAPDGGLVLAGYTYSNDGDVSFMHGFIDYWVIKLAPESSSITPIENPALQLSPNPTATGSVRLTAPGAGSTLRVRVCDLSGRLVLETHVVNDQTLDLEQLPAGVFLVEAIDTEGVRYLGKVLKAP